MGLQQTSYSVGEGDGSQTVCAFLSGSTQREVIVSLSTQQGSAQGIPSSIGVHSAHCKLFLYLDFICYQLCYIQSLVTSPLSQVWS